MAAEQQDGRHRHRWRERQRWRSATITIDAIFQDEFDGKVPDATGIGKAVAAVRAERLGGGDGRVYVMQFTAVNNAGDSCRGSVSVCVPHDQNRRLCVDSGTRYRSTE